MGDEIPAEMSEALNERNYRANAIKAYGEECFICGKDRIVEVHHIDGDRSNNRLDNLVPLCPMHHTEAHRGDVEPQPELPNEFEPVRDARQSTVVKAELNDAQNKAVERYQENHGVSKPEAIQALVSYGVAHRAVCEEELGDL